MVHIYLEDANFPTVIFKPEFVNPRAARWRGI